MKERVYSVLVVSAAEKFNAALAAFLPESTYSPVLTLASVSAAKRALTERAFDFVVINSPLPDDPGIHFAMDAGLTPGTVVLLLVRSEGYEETCDKVIDRKSVV